MEFDLLVRKYLRGTLSSSELERLRDLLERVPEYRTELQQILELRSIIQDDALRLVPPSDLSDRTRESVGAQFAGIESLLKHDASRLATPGELADATRMAVGQLFASSASAAPVGAVAPLAEEASGAGADEETPRRRGVILPFRVIGRTLLAASIAITVALAPTMLGPSSDAPGIADGAARTAAGDRAGGALASADDVSTGPMTPSVTGGAIGAATDRGSTTAADVDEITPLAAASVASAAIAREHSSSTARSTSSSRGSGTLGDARADRAGEADAVTSETAAGTSTEIAATTPEPDAERAPVIDPENPLSRLLRPQLALGDGGVYNPAIDSAMRSRIEPPAPIGPSTIGIPGLADDGRMLAVGVTLGSGGVMDAEAPAALMQNSYYFSFSVSGTDRIGIEMGGSTFLQEKQVPGKRPVGDIFAKQGADDTTAPASLRPGGARTPTVAQRIKSDITYGGVFYDRRLEIESAWDLCGRLTFGAADGALVAGVRAYTAYSPTKNVTFTLGIGGSTLFDLTSHTSDGSTNYGLYYGIETGF